MKTVCINALDDGTYTVGLENESMPEGPESPEGTPMDTQEDQTEGENEQSFQSLDEALNAARTLLSGESKVMIPGEEELQASFVGGFKQARGGLEQGF